MSLRTEGRSFSARIIEHSKELVSNGCSEEFCIRPLGHNRAGVSKEPADDLEPEAFVQSVRAEGLRQSTWRDRRHVVAADSTRAASLVTRAMGRVALAEKNVQVIGGASAGQQLMSVGLLDQIQISHMPVLLGEGLRLFEHIGSAPRRL